MIRPGRLFRSQKPSFSWFSSRHISRTKSKIQAVLLAILLLGLSLRLVGLGQSLWLDEAAQAVMSARSLEFIWFGRVADFHPPLFYFLAHFWMQLGRSETWLRLLPVTFGVANIYAIYLLAQKLFPNQKISLGTWTLGLGPLASLLLAIAPFHVYYSQEFRSYTLLGLLGTLALLFIYEKHFFRLALVNLLLFYSHYAFFTFFAVQVAYFLFYDRQNLSRFIRNTLYVIPFMTPWLPQLYAQLRSGVDIDAYLPGWRSVLSLPFLKALPTVIFKLVAGRISFLSRWLYGLYIVFVFAVTFFGLFVTRHRHSNLYYWVFAPILLLLAVSYWIPQIQPFRLIYILPPLILLFSSASIRYPKLMLTLLVYIALVGNLAYFTRPRLQREQWRQATDFLKSQQSPVIVKFPAAFAPMEWYAPGLSVIPAFQSMPANDEEISAGLSAIESQREVYLLDYLTDLTDPLRLVNSKLTQMGYLLAKTYDYPGVGFIHLYSKI